MERNNTLISDLTESSGDVEVWAKILRVWEIKSAPDEIERHLIIADPNGCRIEVTVPNSLSLRHYFSCFDENNWKVFRRFEVTPCEDLVRNTPHQFKIIFTDRTQVFVAYSLLEILQKFVPVPFNQVLQGRVDANYPIDLVGWVTSFGSLFTSVDDPYEDMFGPITEIRFKLKDESGFELECEAFGELAQELDTKRWMVSKNGNTFLALRFWRVQYLGEGRVRIKDEGPCSKYEFNPLGFP